MTDQPTRTNLKWSEDAIAQLRMLWEDGKSAATIARTLGVPVTRNMVLGKFHRLGLKRPETARPPQPDLKPQTSPSRKVVPEPMVASVQNKEPEPLPSVMTLPFVEPTTVQERKPETSTLPGVPLVEVRTFGCRWPVSPDGAPIRFCNEPFDPANTFSWCPAHMALGIDQRSRAQVRRDSERVAAARAGKSKAA